MPLNDAATLADLAMRLGLLTQSQVEEAWEKLGGRNAQPDHFVRVMERQGYLTPFQSAKLAKGDRDGYSLGGYRLRYKIASGTFGRVYRADDPHAGQVVALKVLRGKWQDDQHAIDLFTREGRMGMSLQHPNIVEILAVDQDPATKQHYIIMEFIEGGDLRDLLAIRKKLSAADTLRILDETTSALAYAFSRGVTHRDLKLTNVLISSQGPAKLVDFGLAGGELGFQEKDDKSVNRTVDYAGLEKATGVPHGDPRSDIFFLGCIAYELLTSRRPLERARGAVARMKAERFQKTAPMRPDEVDAPPSVFHLVDTMMALDPASRFQTPSQLLERVREVRQEIDPRTADRSRGDKRTIFVAESDERLQDLLRTKLKESGYRVLIAADPTRALDRFRQQPFDVLIVNASTIGEEACHMFARILAEAKSRKTALCGILLVDPTQEEWRDRLADQPGVAVLVQPIKFKHLVSAIRDLTGNA
jgi:eukaryotic-like serine/threonine-protein kinase